MWATTKRTPCSSANIALPTWFRTTFSFLFTVGALAIVFALAAHQYLAHHSLPLRAVAAIYSSFLFLIAYVAAPAFSVGRNYLRHRRHALFWIVIWCVPYLVYAAGTGDFRFIALLKLLLISVPPVVVYTVFPVRDRAQLCWQDGLVAASLIGVVLFHGMSGIWSVPVNLDFMARLYLIAVASWCWMFLRPVPELGYTFSITTQVLRAAGLNFLYFAAIALPLGLAMGFIRWNPCWRGVGDFGLQFVEIFLFVAVLEELFFRGFLQTLLTARLHSWWRAQLCIACLFGLFHILHAPFPNWHYVVLASIAAWFYGSAFRQGGTLMASALTHALVDTAWRTWFSAIP